MSKVWNYIVLITGISIIMALAGLNVAGISALLNIIGVTTNTTGITDFASNSSLWTVIFGTSGLLIAIGTSGLIGIGTFLYSKDKAFLVLPIITGTFFYWISVMVSIVNYTKDYEVFGIVVGIILIVLTVGFIQSCVEWFIGTDN